MAPGTVDKAPISWIAFAFASALVLLVSARSVGDSCGSCAVRGWPGTFECSRWSGGATTAFYYSVAYRPVWPLPRIRIVHVYAGPSIDRLACGPDSLRMLSDYGPGYEIRREHLVDYLLWPLHVDRGHRTREVLFPSVTWVVIGLYAWWCFTVWRRWKTR